MDESRAHEERFKSRKPRQIEPAGKQAKRDFEIENRHPILILLNGCG